jgi:demethylmenaquinone methyltransferase/2-methoxy-6-polyprenyl-1,4-benzoquinol methylase
VWVSFQWTATNFLKNYPDLNNKRQTAKKEDVREMFNSIAPRYDFLNHFLSLGIDRLWRRKAIRIIKKHKHDKILDIATGTGDMAILAAGLKPEWIAGVDISSEMINIQKKKLAQRKLESLIRPQVADGENIPFESKSFDVVMTAFGVRNFENLEKGLSEMYRVLNENGMAVILEFSNPQKSPFKQLYNFYFTRILPWIGHKVSKDMKAYTYLPDSVSTFPSGGDFTALLEEAGFKNTRSIPLTFGIASIYTGEKRS